MRKTDKILLELVRAAIGSQPVECDLAKVTAPEWLEVIDLAFEQGVAAIAADGYQKLVQDTETLLDSEQLEELRYEWFGSLLQAEDEYRAYVRAIGKLARAYEGASAGRLKMMLLKGWGLSLNWPVPEHRPVGDIDIYLFGRWRDGDAAIATRGIRIDYSHHHHSVFGWMGQMVENHYDIVNRYASVSGRGEDDLLKNLATQGCREVEVDGAKVLLPSATFNGIFLLTHSAAHFAGDHITLRHLLDWALFVDKEWQEIDWELVTAEAERMGLLRFLACQNGLCVEQLGLDAVKFPRLERDAALEQRVLEDILRPTFSEKGSGFLFKLRRLRANRWKRDLVAAEAFVPRMLRLAWSHLIGPERQLDKN